MFTQYPVHTFNHHEFEDKLTFSIAQSFRLSVPEICAIRVGVHFRAGDVFRGFETPNQRTIPFGVVQNFTLSIQAMLASLNSSAQVYILTELSFQNAIQLSERIPHVNVLFASADVQNHLAVVEICDI